MFDNMVRNAATGATTGFSLVPTGGSWKWPAGAHARRKFNDARENAPRDANQVLEWIQQLYDIEERALEFTAAERLALRQRRRCRSSIGSRAIWTTCRVKRCPSRPWERR